MTNIDTIREALTYYHAHSLSMDEHITANALAALSTIEADARQQEPSEDIEKLVRSIRDDRYLLSHGVALITAHDDAIRRECAERAIAWMHDYGISRLAPCVGKPAAIDRQKTLRAAILSIDPSPCPDERQLSTDALSEACKAIKRFRDLDPTEGSYLQIIGEAKEIFEKEIAEPALVMRDLDPAAADCVQKNFSELIKPAREES